MPDPDYVSKTYTFVPGTDIEAAEVNQNFDDLVNYTNTYVVTRDGSVPFTGIPTVSGAAAVNPSSANQLARKQYVDDQVTTLNAADVQRLKVLNAGPSAVGTTPTISTTQFQVQAGMHSFTAADGVFSITFPTAFPVGVVSIVATVTGSATYEFGTPNAYVRLGAQSKTAFSGIVLIPGTTGFGTNGYPFTSACKVNWIAVGW